MQNQNRIVRELACLLIEHYETPYYHPALRHDVKASLMIYAAQVGYAEFVQGYVDRAKQLLNPDPLVSNGK